MKGPHIKRLQTYFALLATLLTLLSGALIMVVSTTFFGVPLRTILLLVPAGLLTLALSLAIGHFLSEPLTVLVRKVTAHQQGVKVSFTPDGYLQEADELALTIGALIKRSDSQNADLVRKERRQSEFVSDAAHELRTPLTAIRGTAEMLQDPDLPDELREKFGQTIIAESTRLSDLVNDLLSLTRLENDGDRYQLSRINLRDIATNVVDTLQPILLDRQANVQVTGEAPDVLGNADRLKQALTNLVENASRFIEPGGRIEIELCGMRGNSVIQVADDGTGFGDVDPKLLFGRFYRTDASRARSTGGTGLGLSIVKTIIEQHDGTIEAFNRATGGACFIAAIPSIVEAD
ncbi:sensor histidine kinase [Berryella wangjianweii]|uniref:sensor histidine kinase n=1 Tax=Berryella wangjianweii TaxID=2734634 RepID=UPI0021BDE248|nr:HAMP domain-containing histidine kinase [Berryella wangjianweii]